MRGLVVLLLLLVRMTMPALEPDNVVFSRIKAADGLSDNEVQHILQLPDGRMAITTVGNINIYDGSGFSYAHYGSDADCAIPAYKGAYHVYADSAGLVWIKMRGRLRCFDVAAEVYVSDFDSLLKMAGVPERALSDIYFDSEKRIFTVHGRHLWDSRRCGFVRLRSGAELQDVETVADELMLFYSDGVLETFNMSGDSATGEYPSCSNPGMYSGTSLVVPGHDGYVYQIRTGASGASVFQRFSTARRQWEEIMHVPYLLHTLNVGRDGIAFITSAEGLWRVDCHTLECNLVPAIATAEGEIATTRFNTLYIDRQGGIWIGTYNSGLLYGHPSRLMMQTDVSLRVPGGVAADGVNCRFTDKQGRVWMGTPDGLRVLREGATERVLYTEDGMTNNNIKALQADSTGTVWVSTGNGINSVMLLDDGEVEIRGYGAERGALRDEYYAGAAQVLPDGRMAFGGSGGSTVFSPYVSDAGNEELPAPIFRDVQAGGRTYRNSGAEELLRLPYDVDGVSFRVVSMNYANPERTRFEVCIIADGDSMKSGYKPRQTMSDGMLQVSLVNLRPGDYRVVVRTAIDAGQGCGRPSELHFRILPPWWQSGVAKCVWTLLAVLILCVAAYCYRRAVRRRMDRRIKEERLLMRITELIDRCNSYERKELSAGDAPQAGVSAEDRAFIDRAVALVEANISARGYSVEQLSRDLCMERTGLYKRMTSLLDKSPSAFIKSIRLSHAARMLCEGGHTVAEVADITGFSSSSYMSKCFVDTWGCTPMEYVRRNMAKST